MYRSEQLNRGDQYISKPLRIAFEHEYKSLQAAVTFATKEWSSTYKRESRLAFTTAPTATWEMIPKTLRDKFSPEYLQKRSRTMGQSVAAVRSHLLYNWLDQHSYALRKESHDKILYVSLKTLPETVARERGVWLQRYIAAATVLTFFESQMLIPPAKARDLLESNFESHLPK